MTSPATLPTKPGRAHRRRPAGASGHHRGAVAAAVVLAIVGGCVAAVRPRRVVVGGDSMRPTLHPGDRLLVLRYRRPRPGDVVALRDPRHPTRLLVKRVVRVLGHTLAVEGDNARESTDSRVFGPVPRWQVLGIAVRRYAPAHRAGPVR